MAKQFTQFITQWIHNSPYHWMNLLHLFCFLFFSSLFSRYSSYSFSVSFILRLVFSFVYHIIPFLSHNPSFSPPHTCFFSLILLFSCVLFPCLNTSRNGSVGTATGYGLNSRSSIPGIYFSFFHSLQTGSGAHPALYPEGTGMFPPWVKQPSREVDH